MCQKQNNTAFRCGSQLALQAPTGQDICHCETKRCQITQLEQEKDCVEFPEYAPRTLATRAAGVSADRWVTDHWLYFYESVWDVLAS